MCGSEIEGHLVEFLFSSFAGVFFTVKTLHLPLFHRGWSRIEVTHWPLLSSPSSVWVWNHRYCHSNTPVLHGFTHISNFTLFHLVLSAVLFFLVSILMTSFTGQKSSANVVPYAASRKPSSRRAIDLRWLGNCQEVGSKGASGWEMAPKKRSAIWNGNKKLGGGFQ